MKNHLMKFKGCLSGLFGLLSCLICLCLFASEVYSQPLEKKWVAPTKIFLKGTPYELGFQHGQALKEGIAYNIKRYIDNKILANPEHPQIKAFMTKLPQIISHIPQDYMDELKGLADGSEIPFEKVLLLNLFPEMFHCSGMTVKGEATEGRELFHVRVLDYAVAADLQDTAVLMVVQPEGKIPFLNVAYAGFIGSVTGMNAQHISIGEIGGKGYGQYEGMPMAFLIRTILERAHHLQEVKDILMSTTRTCEYYYLFADGKVNETFGAYATSQQLQFIEAGLPYALFDPSVVPTSPQFTDNKLVLNANQMQINPYQTLLYKNEQKQQLWGLIHQQPKDCLVLVGFCRPQRYPVIIQRLLAHYGHIGLTDLQDAIKGEGGGAYNLHTAIFSPASLDVWIAHAGPKGQSAWSQPYTHFNLHQLLDEAQRNSR